MKQAASIALLMLVPALSACGGPAAPAADAAPDPAPSSSNRVAASGKEDVPLAQVPAGVMAAAEGARAGFTPAEAERETRDGRLYYDIGGTLADGAEVEFDIMEENGGWRVVETQRDVAFAQLPAAVREAAAAHDATLSPSRVIESVQDDGLVIYELYAAQGGDPQGRKIELRWDGRRAEVLAREWAH